MRTAIAILATGWAGFFGLLAKAQYAPPVSVAETNAAQALPPPPVIAMAAPPKPVREQKREKERKERKEQGKGYSDAPEQPPAEAYLQGRYRGYASLREWLLARGGAIYALDEKMTATHRIDRKGQLRRFGAGFSPAAGFRRSMALGDLGGFVQGELPAHVRSGILVWPQTIWSAVRQGLREIGASRSIEYEYEVSDADLKITVVRVDGQPVAPKAFFIRGQGQGS